MSIARFRLVAPAWIRYYGRTRERWIVGSDVRRVRRIQSFLPRPKRSGRSGRFQKAATPVEVVFFDTVKLTNTRAVKVTRVGRYLLTRVGH